MEGPSNELLSDFGTVSFIGASATISGQTGSVGSFGANAEAITMVTNKGVTRATTSSLTRGGTSFTVSWLNG
jgi:hypothetical protein